MDVSTLIGHAGDLSALGFVVYLAYRLTTKTIPELTREYVGAANKQREDFREILEKQRDDFRAWNRQSHDVHEARMDALVDAVRTVAREGRGH